MATALETGMKVIRAAAAELPGTPGVYRMLGADGKARYIGKARDLARRVMSYTQVGRLPVRLQRMVAGVAEVSCVHTRTEAEALLLESNLIKREKPRFNILLRDDKSFPYILLRQDHPFAQAVKHRGARTARGRYYGPFAGASDVNKTLIALQKAFLIRNCTDAVFSARKRPCLQHHIKRCTAPCVGHVGQDAYAQQVAQAEAFLDGKSADVRRALVGAMEAAAGRQAYEEAALCRDRLTALTAISAQQDVDLEGLGDADVVALAGQGARRCVYAMFVRGGRVLGGRAYYPRCNADDPDDAVLSAFVAQFYENKPVPPLVLTGPQAPDESGVLSEALSARAGRRTAISCPQRGTRKRVMEMAMRNAQKFLAQEEARRAGDAGALKALGAFLGLDRTPERVEVFDNSHTSGKEMVGAMVVAGPDGFIKRAYRKFTMRDTAPGDDYGAMAEMLTRRFKGAINMPDAVIVDGGVGQLSVANKILKDKDISILGVAKGPDRNAGRERLFRVNDTPVTLDPDDPLLHYIQRLRDEAHRFAIGTHRARRQKRMEGSILDGIQGVGPVRRRALLRHFGSARAVADATPQDLAQVEGISNILAEHIYSMLYCITHA